MRYYGSVRHCVILFHKTEVIQLQPKSKSNSTGLVRHSVTYIPKFPSSAYRHCGCQMKKASRQRIMRLVDKQGMVLQQYHPWSPKDLLGPWVTVKFLAGHGRLT